MELKSILLIIILLVLFLISADQVIKNRKKKLLQKVPEEVIPSPISQGLAYLVGVAGGIYISLVMLTSFLQIAFPETVKILGVEVDLLAAIAFLLAIVQPWIIKIYNLLSNK